MTRKRNDILQGTLDMLVLKTLKASGPLHGYAITAHIQRASSELLRVEEGSLYPALHRMEQSGWVRAAWGVTEKNRQARFYTLTAAGRRQLAREQEGWERLTEGVRLVLEKNHGVA
jgi:transcriptional regulator